MISGILLYAVLQAASPEAPTNARVAQSSQEPPKCSLELVSGKGKEPATSTLTAHASGRLTWMHRLDDVETTNIYADMIIEMDGAWYAGSRPIASFDTPDTPLADGKVPGRVEIDIEPAFFDAFLKAKQMEVWDDTTRFQSLRISRIKKSRRKTWAKCVKEMRKTHPVKPAAVSHNEHRKQAPSQNLTPRTNRAYWVTPNDYPTRALRQEVEGTTRLQLTVGLNGRVRRCDIRESSGSQLLDNAACTAMTRRGRFNPATDAKGRPQTAYDNTAVRWQIPQ